MKFTRPADAKRVHFACDGSIALLDDLAQSTFRVGDTASGSDRLDAGLRMWTCVAIGRSGPAWTHVPWTEDLAQDAVKACDLMVIVNAPSTASPRTPS